jgi:hypothetical protein
LEVLKVIREMTVDAFALGLKSPKLQFVQDGYYISKTSGQVGYWAIYRNGEFYMWYSISATESSFAPDEVMVAITAPTRWVQRENPYDNKKENKGFEATVRSGGHAFMLGANSRRRRFS